MDNRVIVCGFGAVGKKVADVLKDHDMKVLVIELDPFQKDNIRELGYDVLIGDATSAQTLKKANIKTARAIVAAIDNDAKNLFIVLTAHQLNNDIFIATRTKDEMVTEKFTEAGANYIVNSLKSATNEIMNELLK